MERRRQPRGSQLRSASALFALLAFGCASGGNLDTELATSEDYGGSLRVSPDPALFPDTTVGCVRSTILQLENSSADASIQVTGIAVPDETLAFSDPVPFGLAAGETRFVDLHFSPKAAMALAGDVVIQTDEAGMSGYRLATQGSAVDAPEPSPASGDLKPLDLVFVLDVSTSMDEMAALRTAIQELFDFSEVSGLDVRFALTTFENDVIVHGDGGFMERARFFEEFDSQLIPGVWVPNPDLPRQLLNFDFPENSLDAIYRAASDMPFAANSRRYILLMTDSNFLEPPAVFSDGTPVRHRYADVERALRDNDVKLFAVHDTSAGEGLSRNWKGQAPLVSQSGGTWFEISQITTGELTLNDVLAKFIMRSVCDPKG